MKIASLEDVNRLNEIMDYLKKIANMLDAMTGPYKFLKEKNLLIQLYRSMGAALRETLKIEKLAGPASIGVTSQSKEKMLETYLEFKNDGRANEKGLKSINFGG